MTQHPPSRSRVWIAFLLGTLFFFYAFVQRVAPSILTKELMRDFNVDATALGLLSGTYFYTYAAIQLPVGILTDRFGPRKLMSIAIAICAVASFGFAFSNSIFAASVSRAIIGGAVAFAFVGTLTIASTFFDARRFALLAGMLMSVGMAGAVFGQAPLRMLVELFGWRHLFAGLGVIALVMGILSFWLIPRRPVEAMQRSAGVGIKEGLLRVCGNRQSWYCAGMGFGLSATMLSFAALWAVPWMGVTAALPPTEAAAIASMLFIGVAISSLVTGWLSDRLGRRKPMLLAGTALCAICTTVLIYSGVTSALKLSWLFFLCGVGGGSIVVCFGLVRELNSEEVSGTAMGFVNMCVVSAGALLQPAIGWLLDINWQGQTNEGVRVYSEVAYDSALIVLVVASALACICALLVQESYCQSTQIDHVDTQKPGLIDS